MFKIGDIAGVKTVLPILSSLADNGVIIRYNEHNNTTQSPTEEDKKVIAEQLEEGYNVYAIVETHRYIENHEVVLVNYLIMPTEEKCKKDPEEYDLTLYLQPSVDNKYAYATCYCVNKTWPLTEMGDICIREVNGFVVRIQ